MALQAKIEVRTSWDSKSHLPREVISGKNWGKKFIRLGYQGVHKISVSELIVSHLLCWRNVDLISEWLTKGPLWSWLRGVAWYVRIIKSSHSSLWWTILRIWDGCTCLKRQRDELLAWNANYNVKCLQSFTCILFFYFIELLPHCAFIQTYSQFSQRAERLTAMLSF